MILGNASHFVTYEKLMKSFTRVMSYVFFNFIKMIPNKQICNLSKEHIEHDFYVISYFLKKNTNTVPFKIYKSFVKFD